jgi:hypothetical protein
MFAFFVGEPLLDRAIALEEHAGAAQMHGGAAHQHGSGMVELSRGLKR